MEENPETAFSRLMKRQQNIPAHALFQYFRDEAESEMYQRLFQLARTEELEVQQPATVFDPSLKEHVNGRLYISQNYVPWDTLCLLGVGLCVEVVWGAVY